MHPLTSVMLLHSTLVKALHGARKGRSQRVDLEALRLKALLLCGAPGVVLLVTPGLQCTKDSAPPPTRQGLFSNYFHLTQKK